MKYCKELNKKEILCLLKNAKFAKLSYCDCHGIQCIEVCYDFTCECGYLYFSVFNKDEDFCFDKLIGKMVSLEIKHCTNCEELTVVAKGCLFCQLKCKCDGVQYKVKVDCIKGEKSFIPIKNDDCCPIPFEKCCKDSFCCHTENEYKCCKCPQYNDCCDKKEENYDCNECCIDKNDNCECKKYYSQNQSYNSRNCGVKNCFDLCGFITLICGNFGECFKSNISCCNCCRGYNCEKKSNCCQCENKYR